MATPRIAPPRYCERLYRACPLQRGQALVLALFTSVLVILALFAMYSIGGQAIEKMRLQNTADSAAYSAAVAEARDYNFSAYTNRAMIANQVAVAQFVGLTSWFRNMSKFANGDSSNVGRDVYDTFFMIGSSPVATIYKKFLKVFGKVTGLFDEGKGGSTFMTAAVTVLDGLIAVYSEMQRVYHYATALSVAETLGAFSTIGGAMNTLLHVDWFSGLTVLDGGDDIIKANDPKARLTTTAGLGFLAKHYYGWFKFTTRKDPNTDGADGPDADRFAQVTLDSLDDFSRDRSTKPAWGFSFFYAPPLTYIDPTRFIPYQNGPLFLPVIHRGGTELKLTDESGHGGTSGTGGGDGSTGVDCHGNPVSAGGSTSAVSVDYFSQLPAATAACEGDAGMVTKGDGSGAQGVYAVKSNAWVFIKAYDKNDPSGNTQGNPSGRTTSGSGNTGPANSKSKKTWTALDASSWAGLDIIWITIPIIFIPIPLPIPFAPPWIPLSHGAAQSGRQLAAPTVLAADNNFGVSKDEAYGNALSHWTTTVSAEMQQPKGAGKSLDWKPDTFGGLTGYMDLANVDAGNENATGPELVVEIEKSIDDMIKNPGSGQFATESGAPTASKLSGAQTMRGLSKSQTFFSRPTTDSSLKSFQRTDGTATQVEYASLYNPYWQARLMPNSFVEQYLSMEIHRVGM